MAVDGKLPIQPPVGLSKDARAAWESAVAFAPAGFLAVLDHSVLERWARNYALYRKLSSKVESDGGLFAVDKDGNEAPSAAYNMLMKVQAAIAQCEKELGFTPVSRARVRVNTDNDEGNEFEAF